MPSAGSARTTSSAADATAESERPAQDAVEDGAPEPGLAARAAPPPDERDAALLDPVAELRERRREHRQRARDGDGDDEDRADPDRRPDRGAAEEHAGQRGDHRQAGDEHGPAGRGRGGFERRLVALAGRTLLAFALEVEERVVDSDGEPDQQDHRVRCLVHGEDLAREGKQADRREHRGQAEQHRDPRCDGGAEDDDQNAERDRQGGVLGPLEVLADGVVEGLRGACAAELLDAEVVMPGLHPGDGGEHGLDALGRGVAGVVELELHQHRPSVLRDEVCAVGVERRAHVRDAGLLRDRGDYVLDDRAEGGIAGLRGAALDEDALVGRVAVAAPVDDLLRPAGLADAELVGVELLGSDHAAEDDGGDDECEPTEDGRLAVARAPAAHPGREVVRALQR